jgi:hypothetical protein
VAFYEDFMLVDEETRQYVFIPSYSPETGAGITATMDVMVCKDALRSLITASRVLQADADKIPHWEGMLERLPDYRINSDGALAEWIPEGGSEHYRHRHLSHLHSCYEALEDPELDENPALWKAAQEATLRRIDSGGEVSSHGRAHMGLAAAHLGMAEEAYGRIQVMVTGASMYDSLMCSHEPNGRIFNLDANGAMPEIMNRMLVRSHPRSLDLLPALPQAWPRGEIRGIRARQCITVHRLAWDREAGRLTLRLTSDCDQDFVLRIPKAETIRSIDTTHGSASILTSDEAPNSRTVGLKAGETVEFEIQASL